MAFRLPLLFGVLLLLSMQAGSVAKKKQPAPLEDGIFFQSKQFQRWYWLYQRRASEGQQILPGTLRRAARQLELARGLRRKESQRLGQDDPERWVSLGPTPIDVSGRTDYAGRTAAVAVDPADAAHWLIGAAQGGIWETVDAGRTWESRSDSLKSLASGAIAFSSSHPGVVYAGTGESTFSGSSYGGLGLLKSLDGGSSWSFVHQDSFSGRGISEIRIHPDDPDTLLVTSVSAVSPVAESTSVGIFKSEDGGETFALTKEGQANDLEVHPDNFDYQYASLSSIFGSEEHEGLYRSLDQGTTWEMVDGPWADLMGGVGRMELALSPSRPDRLVVSVQDAFTQDPSDGRLLGIWMADNAWTARPDWAQLPTPGAGNTVWYNQQIAFHPGNHNFIFFGEISLWIFDGSSWSRISPPHVDQHAFAWAGGRLVVGNDGGVYSSLDLGGSWFVHNQGLTITQFYLGSIHPFGGEFGIGGAQDNGTAAWSGANRWDLLLGGDGAASVISPSTPEQHWAVSSQRLGIFRTTNGGGTFSRADGDIDKSAAPFIAILKGCPFDEDVLIAGTDRVWKASDFFRTGEPTWEGNSPELESEVSALAFSPADPNCESYVVGTISGRLNLTTDGGSSWTDLDPFESIPLRPITDLVFDGQDPDLLYAALGGFDLLSQGPFEHVFVTKQAFATPPGWRNISPPIDVPVQALAALPEEPSLYAGTDLGLWKSPDQGETWYPVTAEQGFPTVAVLDLAVTSEGRTVAFTHGRGAFLKTEASLVDLSIQLDASPRAAFVDEVVNWQMRATNNGPGDTQEIEVELELEFGHELEQLPDQCVSGKGQITCHLAELVHGQTVSLEVTSRSAQTDLLAATASITGPAPDPVANNNLDSLEVQATLARDEWIIPFFHGSPQLGIGIAVANLSASDSNLLLRAFLQEGAPPLPLNPRSYRLPRRRQSTLLPREIFGEWPDSATGWVRIRADSLQLAGFFQVFGRSSLDGAAPATGQFQQAVFTRVIHGPRAYRMLPATTHLSLVNPNQESVEVLLRLGQGPLAPLARSRTITVKPEGFLFQSVADLFEIEGTYEGSVVVEVVEGPGLAGFQLIEIDGGETLIGLNPAHQSTAVRLYSAQAASGTDLFTNLKLFNTASESRQLALEFRRDDGELVGEAVELAVGPGEEIQEDIRILFGLPRTGASDASSADPVTGSLAILADGPGIVGDILFGDPGGRYGAALPLQTRLFSRAAFGQVASGQGLFTGVAVYNPNENATDVRLSVFAPSGTGRGAALFTLEGGQRLSRTLVELVPRVDGQVDGYVTLESEQPIVAQQLLADRELNFLSAVPATIIE